MAKPNKKYIVFPSHIESINDGDIHFISAHKLMSLYNVNPKECITFGRGMNPDHYDHLIPLITLKDECYLDLKEELIQGRKILDERQVVLNKDNKSQESKHLTANIPFTINIY